MTWIGEIIYSILRAVLPWLFSGEEKSKVTTHPGLQGLDYKALSGNGKLSAKDLPALLLLFGILPGCAFGGARVEHHYHMVEPGAVVEIVDERPIKVRAPGTDDVGQIKLTGAVATPKSVYRELRDSWLKEHPEGK